MTNKNYLKCCKVSKYDAQDCLKVFLPLSTTWTIIHISENSCIFAQKREAPFLTEKKTPPKVESFPMTPLDPNKTWKIVLRENCCICNFSATGALYICIKGFRKVRKLIDQIIEVWRRRLWVKSKDFTNAIMSEIFGTE